MFKKINESAFFVVDESSYYKQFTYYDPKVANQTIFNDDFFDIELPHVPEMEIENVLSE